MDESASEIIATQRAARARIIETFERAGATSPATARRLGQLARMDDGVLRGCVEHGMIREAAPGTFYLSRLPASLPPGVGGPSRLVKTLSFWIVAVIVPILYVWFAGR